MEPPPLYELTKSFCVAFYDNNQAALNQLLSADCRMQNRYGKSARGVNGVSNCINKLITVRSNLGMYFPHGQGGSEMFVETFDSNVSQSCCLLTISTADRLRRLSVCFGLEWDSNIIIGVVFRFNVDPKTYIRDLYNHDCDDSGVRAPTSWDMAVSITGAVLSSADLDDASARGQEEQFIFLHRKDGGDGEGASLESGARHGASAVASTAARSRGTLSELTARGPPPAGTAPLVSCLRVAASAARGQTKGGAQVRFSLDLSVVLVPELKSRPNDGIFYTHIDFRRFTADAEDDITELIKLSKSSFMDKEAAKLVLYQDPSVPLMTQFNAELAEDEGGELSESEASGPASESSLPAAKRAASLSREPSLTRTLSFDDDVDRDSFSRHHGLSVDGLRTGKSAAPEETPSSWFDRLFDIITTALDSDQPPPSQTGRGKRNSVNYYLNTSQEDRHQMAVLPLGYSLGRLLAIPPELDRREHWITIDVSVIGCNNLKSALKRLVPRPVDSFVEIRIDEQIQCTEVVKNDKNPLYDLSSTYSFRLKPSQAGLNNFILFTVFDEGIIDNSTLGYAKVSFAALKAQKDNNDPTAIILPISKHIEDIDGMGKGFYNSNNYYLTRSSVSRDSRYSSRDSFSQKNKMVKSAKETPTISIAVSKIDLLTHGMLEALRNADEENSRMVVEKEGADIWTF